MFPLGLTALLAACGLAPAARAQPAFAWSFFGAALALVAWAALLGVVAARRGRTLAITLLARKQHYLQACAHLSIYAYWGWYWRPVYDSAWLIGAQILFAYAFDMLLAWSRRDSYALGFGPLPIILSTNLFLWFKPDWFYLQFAMVGVGFLAKELLRWRRAGRSAHIFNPSSLPLSLFSLGLILTGTTDHTWGREIATTLFYPPHIYLWIFLVGLPGQMLFGVASMTAPAVITAWLFSVFYLAATGTYFFFDSYIPIAVFLGMHLLFTDPSTAPETELGRIGFGVAYGAGVVSLYWLLGVVGAPTFYDKLLPVPLLNLCVQAFDRLARAPMLRRFDPARLGEKVTPRRRNLGYVAVWAVAFAVLSGTKALGDTHPGNRIPFWQQACREGRRNACRNLATMEAKHCYRGMGWACNELGILIAEGSLDSEATPQQLFALSCRSGFEAGCRNAAGLGPLVHQPPRVPDYRSLLETKGFPIADTELQLVTNACEQGWADACALARTLRR